jgi:hypothetical protein
MIPVALDEIITLYCSQTPPPCTVPRMNRPSMEIIQYCTYTEHRIYSHAYNYACLHFDLFSTCFLVPLPPNHRQNCATANPAQLRFPLTHPSEIPVQSQFPLRPIPCSLPIPLALFFFLLLLLLLLLLSSYLTSPSRPLPAFYLLKISF